jgi:hypothetical protein
MFLETRLHMVTLEELEQRVRLLEVDSRSEKGVSRQTLELLNRMAETLHAHGTTQAAHSATLAQHGAMLALLQQDVAALRNGQIDLHREMNARFDLVLEAIRNIGPRDDRT